MALSKDLFTLAVAGSIAAVVFAPHQTGRFIGDMSQGYQETLTSSHGNPNTALKRGEDHKPIIHATGETISCENNTDKACLIGYQFGIVAAEMIAGANRRWNTFNTARTTGSSTPYPAQAHNHQ